MTTLPAMSDEQIAMCYGGALIRNDTTADIQRDFAQGLIAARDAQWQAAVDAAVMQERERIFAVLRSRADYEASGAAHYAGTDHRAYEYHLERHSIMVDMMDAIRARTKEKT